MTTASTLAAALEFAFDLYLRQDPQSLQRCTDMTGKCIAVALSSTHLVFYFLPDSDGIQILSQYEGNVDTLLTGSPLGFTRLSLNSHEDAIFQGAVQIEGDTEAGQQFQDILAACDWDWEEQLSKFTGDIFAHQTGKLLHQVKRFVSDSSKTFTENSSEYLQEEAKILPTRIEVDYFLEDVDQLRSGVDRLHARVDRLINSLDGQ